MTDDEIDALPSGAEMNKRVHEMVFGRKVEFRAGSPIGRKLDPDGTWTTVYGQDYYFDPDDTTLYYHVTAGFTGMIPNYSARIADAWAVVSKVGLCVDYQTNWCIVSKNGEELSRTFNDPPKAICIAALKVINNVPNTQAQ